MFKRIFKILLLLNFGCAQPPITHHPIKEIPSIIETPTVETQKPTTPENFLAGEIIKKAENLHNKTIAVFNFTYIDGSEFNYGKLLAEKLIVELVSSGKLKVVERTQLEKILQQQKLEISDLFETTEVEKVGKLIGTDAVVIGTIAEFPEKYEITAKLINIYTGEIISALNFADTKKLTPTTQTTYNFESEFVNLERASPDLTNEIRIINNKIRRISKDNPEYLYLLFSPQPPKPLIMKFKNEYPLIFKDLQHLRLRLKYFKDNHPVIFNKMFRKFLETVREDDKKDFLPRRQPPKQPPKFRPAR